MKKSIENRLVKITMLFVLFFFAIIGSNAQILLPQFVIHFRVGASNVDINYMENRIALSKISALTPENAYYISSIRIEGYASPEGAFTINELLSWKRAEALKRYIITNYSYIQPEKIIAQGMGVNWKELRGMAEADPKLPRRQEILYIIDHVHAHIDVKANVSRKKSIMDLGTQPWNYMLANYFPLLRTGVTIIMKPDTPREVVISISKTLDSIDNVPLSTSDTAALVRITSVKNVPGNESEHLSIIDTTKNTNKEPLVADSAYIEKIVEKEVELERKPLFAVKTNMLYDVVSALNVELEVLIGKRWSIAGEYIFPWWLWEEKQIAFEMLNANIEGRYWFGDRANKKALTGWNMGLYAGGGYFDFEWKDKGYQGEFFIATGLSTSYTHTISKNGNWRMEYGLGLGIIQTNYHKYVPKRGIDNEWHLIRQSEGKHTWIGPSKAKISLVWIINNRGAK